MILCPLCKKPLLEAGTEPEDTDLFCLTRIYFPSFQKSIPHYEVRDNIPIWYAPPYRIKYVNGIYYIAQAQDCLQGKPFNKPDFKEIFQTSQEIKAEEPSKMALRIKNLIIFS